MEKITISLTLDEARLVYNAVGDAQQTLEGVRVINKLLRTVIDDGYAEEWKKNKYKGFTVYQPEPEEFPLT